MVRAAPRLGNRGEMSYQDKDLSRPPGPVSAHHKMLRARTSEWPSG